MYTPSSFAVTDVPTLHALIRSHSFATLVSVTDREPVATHMPLLLDAESSERGRLIGHVARANPQWQPADSQNVLCIFQGPHAYISPSWYDDQNVVPTWNYVAVHVYGTLRVQQQTTDLLEIVEQYVKTYESDMREPWRLNSAEPGFVENLLNAIVGFTIDIDRIEGKRKLSQNQSAARREGVVKGLLKRNWSGDQDMAQLVRETLTDVSPV